MGNIVIRVNRRLVDFNSSVDREVLVLGRLGFSTEMIRLRTGLTKGQVLYRLRAGGVVRSEYRGGYGVAAQMALRLVAQQLRGRADRERISAG